MDVRAGEQITKHLRLVRELGRGGMGSVWVAEHLTLETEVAVKFVLTALGDREASLARFRREATAAAQIQSPHVVQIFDHGVTDDGTPYIVMELLRGESLAERLQRRGRLGLGDVATLLEQLAKALSAAHHEGIVHRDIKPENIFCLEQPGAPADEIFVKLLDFGIARPVAESPSSHVTKTGALIGTPAFMSPEQLGDTGRIGPATDLWALGVVAYSALCGKLPFEGTTPVSYWRAMTSTSFPRPTSIVEGLPVELDGWFRRAFRVEPEDRFESARAMAGALREMALESVATRPSPAPLSSGAAATAGDTDGDAQPHADTELASIGTADFVQHEELGVQLEVGAARSDDTDDGSPEPLASEPEAGDTAASDPGTSPRQAGQAAEPASTRPPGASPHQSTGFAAALATGATRAWRGGRSRTVVYLGAVALVAGALWLGDRFSEPDGLAADTTGLGASGSDGSPSASANGSNAPPLREPNLGLRALRDYHDPNGSSISNLRSASLWTAAARDFSEACQQKDAPRRWRAGQHFAECQLALVKNDVDGGVAACRKAAAADPQWASPHAGLCAALSRKGDLQAALDAAERAQRLEPGWWRAVAMAAAAYSSAGKFAEGIQEFRRALELAPNNAVLLGELALMYHAARMDSEAERFADQALEADGDLVPVRVLRAERALERADGKIALAEATRAVSVAPKDISARLAYADAHALLEHRQQAVTEYRRVLELHEEGDVAGAPVDRIKLVKEALARDELPAARHVLAARARPAQKSERSRPKASRRSRPDVLELLE